jgi:PAS domain S-box-containing protein/excisionase family DNA binding protein
LNERHISDEWVLVVDDDELVADALEALLSYNGHTVRTANSGAQALQMLSPQPAVVLLDIRLQDMSGVQLLSHVKRECPDTEAIMLTGYASQESAIEAVNLGAYAYVQKPHDTDGLLLTIQRAMEKRHTLSALRRSEARFRKLFQNMREAFVSADEDGTIAEVNPAAARMLGFDDPRQLVGTGVKQLFSSPDDYEALCEILRQDAETQNHELKLTKADGDSVWVLGSVTLTLDEDSGQHRSEAIFADITDRKREEEVLEFERSRLEMVTSSVGAGMAVIARNRKVLWANNSVVRDFGAVAGQSCHLCLKAQPEPCTVCELEDLFVAGATRKVLFSNFIKEDGSEFEAQVVLTPLTDDEGNVVAALELIIPLVSGQLTSSDVEQKDGIGLAGRLSEIERVRGALVDMLDLKDGQLKATPERWMSVGEVADYMGVKRDTIYKWLRNKDLPAHKVGKLWRFRKSELEEWVGSLER